MDFEFATYGRWECSDSPARQRGAEDMHPEVAAGDTPETGTARRYEGPATACLAGVDAGWDGWE